MAGWKAQVGSCRLLFVSHERPPPKNSYLWSHGIRDGTGASGAPLPMVMSWFTPTDLNPREGRGWEQGFPYDSPRLVNGRYASVGLLGLVLGSQYPSGKFLSSHIVARRLTVPEPRRGCCWCLLIMHLCLLAF